MDRNRRRSSRPTPRIGDISGLRLGFLLLFLSWLQAAATLLGLPQNRAVASRSYWGVAPRQSIEAECARRGRQAVVDGCTELVTGGEADAALIVALGGPAARGLLDAGLPKGQLYWLRVWGARGLLWVWEDSATGAIYGALGDGAWRVREMAVKVVARHRLGDALSTVASLRDDPVSRVRAAASRAVTVLTAARA